jgi:competence protein ComEC
VEVYFLDVGLGSCQIILLGGRRAIVIDCGVKSDHLALHFLKRFGIIEIECLLTSHSDNDHTGGAISILDDYQDQIKRLFVVQDHKWLATRYWQRIDHLIETGILQPEQVDRLEMRDRPKELWRDSSTRLKLFSPSFIENLRSQQAQNANATSSVIVLDHLDHRFVFAADSEIPQWKQIYERRGSRKLKCDVLAVPHHGGLIDDSGTDLDWLYDKAVAADFAILSVGTRTTPKHPREEVVAKLVTSGATVLCTEVTRKCHKHPGALSPGVLRPLTLFGRAFDSSRKGRDNAVACAGTVLAQVDSSGLRIDRLVQHQAAVDALAKAVDGCSLCR